jgi:hypothetical protein
MSAETKYDVDYFIKKFEAIPEVNWTTGVFNDGCGRFCALGHCGETFGRTSQEAFALRDLLDFELNESITRINDGNCPEYDQPTPRARILAALRDIKAKQEAAK